MPYEGWRVPNFHEGYHPGMRRRNPHEEERKFNPCVR
ncbi:predicted protein [Sclerotinia sclerotiorum 1980 UF-70]|uniref:Uncharacterized protein n=1 Tax=Sclerotinia sclerotiorum (strain ATCC 18683 / 1980 / Ss-1) TaxID=665079 RepID=A7EB17_SCLS1|nr:predicted protein [Sclerotinia sclerotiorum 1980 UF-70]EDN99645.1 predicted protein [Sclerotinia sclerotiorum 1980 UF-70]